MAPTMQEPVVHFINSSDPSAPKSDGVRALIRKQAMKHVAETRKTSRSAKKRAATAKDKNKEPAAAEKDQSARAAAARAKQVVKPPQPDEVAKAETGIYKLAFESLHSLLPGLAKPPPLSGYAALRSTYNLDVGELSMLTTFHVGRSTLGISKDILGMGSMLRAQIPSYLAELPKLHGRNTYLDAALECLLGRMQSVISPASTPDETQIISTYYKAIKGLQGVLNDPKEQRKPEVLAAVSLLSLFEIVDEYNVNAWKQHADGAAKLIQLRGPVIYENELEKSLFEAQLGPLITEAVLDNRHCFLESPSWDPTFESITREGDLNLRSPIIIQVRRLFSILPGIFSDITHLICSEDPPHPDALRAILSRCNNLQAQLLTWRNEIEVVTKAIKLSEFQKDLVAEVIATYLGLVLILDRLIASISFNQLQAYEGRALGICSQLIAMEQLNLPESPHLLLFVKQKGKLAYSVLATSAAWLAADMRPVEGYEHGGILPSAIFVQWCMMIKRKCS